MAQRAAAVKALGLPEVREKLVAQQAVPVGNSPDAFAAEIARELARHKRAAEAAGIRIDRLGSGPAPGSEPALR